MTENSKDFQQSALNYLQRLQSSFTGEKIREIEHLSLNLLKAWVDHKQVFICGNGGSAANSIHMANDFHYGIGACGHDSIIPGLKVEALPANTGILTCLANDLGYENIFSQQLMVKANSGDILIALSGSGNSQNIVNALTTASELKMISYAIVAFDGGRSKDIADHNIHFQIDDMQIAEDTQLIIGHLCMQWLNKHKPNNITIEHNG